MPSCLYAGTVRHQRRSPVEHRFSYRTWMLYLDLDEAAEAFSHCPLLSRRRYGIASYLRSDHWGDPQQPLAESIRSLVQHETGMSLAGPVRLLTQLRQFGHYFSPLNLYYCFDTTGDTVAAIVAEVSNIPWGERHMYVLWEGNRVARQASLSFAHPKAFHVSPFMAMDQTYAWQLAVPDQELSVEIESSEGDHSLFRARMELTRYELSAQQLAWQLMRSPLATVQTVVGIYYQAWKLWRKQCPYYPHPPSKLPAARTTV